MLHSYNLPVYVHVPKFAQAYTCMEVMDFAECQSLYNFVTNLRSKTMLLEHKHIYYYSNLRVKELVENKVQHTN